MKTQTQQKQKPVDPKISKIKGERTWILNLFILVVFIVYVLIYTKGKNTHLLWKLQDLDFFSLDWTFFRDKIQHTGGFSSYLGSFLSQFFYHPWLGSIIYLLMLLLITFITSKSFDLKKRLFPLAFLPSLALLLTMTELGYLVYILKIDGYVFNNAIGVIFTLSGLLIFKKIKKNTYKIICIVLYLFIAYPLSGFFAILGGFIIFIHLLKQYFSKRDKSSLINATVSILTIVLVPYFYYFLVFKDLPLVELFTSNLPNFKLKGSETLLWLPFWILSLTMVAITLFKKDNPTNNSKLIYRILPSILFLSFIIIVSKFSFEDDNFKTEIMMLKESENYNWNKVLNLTRKQKDEPTRQILMNTKLALYKLGMLGDKSYHYKNGNKQCKSPRPIKPMYTSGKFFYYQYGLMNYCYKWCMEDMVEYGMSVSVLKYFVLSSLFNGETALAQKYNDVLKSTIYYRSWALEHQRFIDNPEEMEKESRFTNLLAITKIDDIIDLDQGKLEDFIRDFYANIQGGSKDIVELSIMFNLELKNIEGFWPRLFYWCGNIKGIPVHFQEAALLFQELEHKYDLEGAPFDKEVIDNFKNFLNVTKNNSNYPPEVVKRNIYNQFGNTYWYYYSFENLSPEDKNKNKSLHIRHEEA